MKTNFHSLNTTYNFCALKNLQFRFQEKNSNLNRDSSESVWHLSFQEERLNMNWNGNLDNSIGKSAGVWRSEVRIPVQVKIFLLKSKLIFNEQYV